jgi:hypothetical protein
LFLPFLSNRVTILVLEEDESSVGFVWVAWYFAFVCGRMDGDA